MKLYVLDVIFGSGPESLMFAARFADKIYSGTGSIRFRGRVSATRRKDAVRVVSTEPRDLLELTTVLFTEERIMLAPEFSFRFYVRHDDRTSEVPTPIDAGE